jgi:hypothetical protein
MEADAVIQVAPALMAFNVGVARRARPTCIAACPACSRLLPQGVTQHGARSGSYRNASDVAENDKLVSAQSSAEAPLAVILSGMSFDATYAIATLLAKNSLTIDRHELPRGQLLVMGGDEVYPLADKKIYRDQLVAPYTWAFPDHDPHDRSGTPICAIPGNHDWYDGLLIFLAWFASDRPNHIGSWRTCQNRSYFAFELTERWWLWCLDTQLDDDVDQPQQDYFEAIARNMPENARIILCGPEPGWLYTKAVTDYTGTPIDPGKRTKSSAAFGFSISRLASRIGPARA